MAAGVGGVLAVLRWREEHQRPYVSAWVGHWRDNAHDAGKMVIECTFANRGHDRELTRLWFELRRVSAVVEYTTWKSPEAVKAGSTRSVEITLERLRNDAGVYLVNRSERDAAEVLADLRVVFITGDGEQHTTQLARPNRDRLTRWLVERRRAD